MWANVTGAGVHVYKHVYLPPGAQWPQRQRWALQKRASDACSPFPLDYAAKCLCHIHRMIVLKLSINRQQFLLHREAEWCAETQMGAAGTRLLFPPFVFFFSLPMVCRHGRVVACTATTPTSPGSIPSCRTRLRAEPGAYKICLSIPSARITG